MEQPDNPVEQEASSDNQSAEASFESTATAATSTSNTTLPITVTHLTFNFYSNHDVIFI